MSLINSLLTNAFPIAHQVHDTWIEDPREWELENGLEIVDDEGANIVLSFSRVKAIPSNPESRFGFDEGGARQEREINFKCLYPSGFVRGQQIACTDGTGRITGIEPTDNRAYELITIRMHSGGNR